MGSRKRSKKCTPKHQTVPDDCWELTFGFLALAELLTLLRVCVNWQQNTKRVLSRVVEHKEYFNECFEDRVSTLQKYCKGIQELECHDRCKHYRREYDSFVFSFKELKYLKYWNFRISGYVIMDQFLANISSKLPKIERLDFRGGKISWKFLCCNRLRVLRISAVYFSRDDFALFLKKTQTLETLDIVCISRITGESLADVFETAGALPNIQELFLSTCQRQFRPLVQAFVSAMRNLQVVSFRSYSSDNDAGAALTLLSALPQLRSLKVEGVDVSNFPTSMFIPSLKEFWASSCSVNDTGIGRIARVMTNLEKLRLFGGSDTYTEDGLKQLTGLHLKSLSSKFV